MHTTGTARLGPRRDASRDVFYLREVWSNERERRQEGAGQLIKTQVALIVISAVVAFLASSWRRAEQRADTWKTLYQHCDARPNPEGSKP